MEILLVLGLPLLGAILLAWFGARRFAPELNAGVSLATLVVSALLVLRVIRHGPVLAGRDQFFVDSFNVFLVALTAFVGFTTALFSRPYMRIEEHHGRVNAKRLRLYQVITKPPYFSAPFDAVVAVDLGPDVANADIGLTAVPGQRSRVPNHGAGESARDVDVGHATGEAVQVYTLDADGIGSVAAAIGVKGDVVIVA